MTAVIYARYSSDNQREESIEGQIRECTAYAEKNGITIVKHYIDRAISAKTDNRPEFQQMIKDSDKKLFDIVLVWKLDRFARNRYDSARYKTQLKKNGVKLMSATEIISEGPEGIILESVLEGYAEYYSADLAEKVVRGQTENILKGRCNGGRGTFGYTLDSERKFHIDPLTSPFVLESFKKYNEGSTMKEIRDWLNENGIKNPVGGAFTYNSVEHMLKNRRYIGELKFRDVVVPDAIPPIIPLELFEDVQEKIAKNKKAPARRKAEDDYLLTTKLFCGYCGALMFGESVRNCIRGKWFGFGLHSCTTKKTAFDSCLFCFVWSFRRPLPASKDFPGRGKMSHSDKKGSRGRRCPRSVLIFQSAAKRQSFPFPRRSLLLWRRFLQKIHAGRVAAAYRMCYDEVQNLKRSDGF